MPCFLAVLPASLPCIATQVAQFEAIFVSLQCLCRLYHSWFRKRRAGKHEQEVLAFSEASMQGCRAVEALQELTSHPLWQDLQILPFLKAAWPTQGERALVGFQSVHVYEHTPACVLRSWSKLRMTRYMTSSATVF